MKFNWPLDELAPFLLHILKWSSRPSVRIPDTHASSIGKEILLVSEMNSLTAKQSYCSSILYSSFRRYRYALGEPLQHLNIEPSHSNCDHFFRDFLLRFDGCSFISSETPDLPSSASSTSSSSDSDISCSLACAIEFLEM